jgi:hypothetical protein
MPSLKRATVPEGIETNPPAFRGGACGRSIQNVSTCCLAYRRNWEGVPGVEHPRRGASTGRNHARRTDKPAEPLGKSLAGVGGWSWSAGCSRVDAVLRLAPRSRPSGDLLRAITNSKRLAMASKRPSFEEEMLAALSLCARRSGAPEWSNEIQAICQVFVSLMPE